MLAKFKHEKFHPEYVRKEAGPTVAIEEKKAAGSGTISFKINGSALAIRNPSDKPPLAWSKIGKCADGAIVFEKDGGIHAHLVELKGSVGPGAWLGIKQQFHGMLLNIIAISAIGEIDKPNSVICHVAFKTDTFKSTSISDPALIKTLTGGVNPLGGSNDWAKGKFELTDFGEVEFRKIQRDKTDGTGAGVI